jgi:hypothetical protein
VLEEARRLLLLGWSVIPLKPGGKAPLLRWRKFMTARPSEDDLLQWWKRWPDANLGVVTGAVSGISVLDVESTGLWALDVWHVSRTVTSVSQGGGRHFFFVHEAAHGTGPWNIDGLHVGDFRAEGGIIALPPSRGPSGAYLWDIAPWDREMCDAPSWFAVSQRSAPPKGPLDGPGLAKTGKTGRWASRSERDWAEATRLLASAVPVGEVVAAIATGEAARSRSRPLDYASRTVERARASLVAGSTELAVRRVKVSAERVRLDLEGGTVVHVRRDSAKRRHALAVALGVDPFVEPAAARGRLLRVLRARNGAIRWFIRLV